MPALQSRRPPPPPRQRPAHRAWRRACRELAKPIPAGVLWWPRHHARPLGGSMRSVSGSLIAILAVAAFGVSMAHADIAAFNNRDEAGDFKAASSEAAATWPTLDKNRDDIEVIAREFGFAAYMAGDYPAALNLAEFAATHAPMPARRRLSRNLAGAVPPCRPQGSSICDSAQPAIRCVAGSRRAQRHGQYQLPRRRRARRL